MNEHDHTVNTRRTLKIEISGAPNTGKTVITALLAKALAKTFEEIDMLTSIKVANLDGDYPTTYHNLDAILEDWKKDPRRLDYLKEVLFVEIGSAMWSSNLKKERLLSEIAVAGNHHCIGLPDFAYLGPALIDKDETEVSD